MLGEKVPFMIALLIVFLTLISQLMVNCLLAGFGLFPSPSTLQFGVPLVMVAMATSGTPATGWKVCFSWYRLATIVLFILAEEL